MKLGLHIGCGPIRLESTPTVQWVNIDVDAKHQPDLTLDCLNLLAHFGPASADYLWTCHHLEHLAYPAQTVSFLAQCHAVLRPGGVIRIAVPDLEAVAKAYVARADMNFIGTGQWYHYKPLRADRLHYFITAWEHRICFDFELLSALLADAGFGTVANMQSNHSAIEGFHFDRFQGATIYAEAIR